jgi:hypothetical protein
MGEGKTGSIRRMHTGQKTTPLYEREEILSTSALALAMSRERNAPPTAASMWSYTHWLRPWKKF